MTKGADDVLADKQICVESDNASSKQEQCNEIEVSLHEMQRRSMPDHLVLITEVLHACLQRGDRETKTAPKCHNKG